MRKNQRRTKDLREQFGDPHRDTAATWCGRVTTTTCGFYAASFLACDDVGGCRLLGQRRGVASALRRDHFDGLVGAREKAEAHAKSNEAHRIDETLKQPLLVGDVARDRSRSSAWGKSA